MKELLCNFYAFTVTFQGCYLTETKYYINIFSVQQANTEGQFSELITEEYFKSNMNIFFRINGLKIPVRTL